MGWTSVAELNRRYQRDGWRSASNQRHCPGCGTTRPVLETTIYGKTRFECAHCGHGWIPDPYETTWEAERAVDVSGAVMHDP